MNVWPKILSWWESRQAARGTRHEDDFTTTKIDYEDRRRCLIDRVDVDVPRAACRDSRPISNPICQGTRALNSQQTLICDVSTEPTSQT